ncbi:MAG: putative toxin-antitoxin system toxin component, PIN family [Betaproteobacteria bacterium]
MRVVIDTNVVVAGLLSALGPPGWIVEATLSGRLEPAFGEAIRHEYDEVLHRPEFGFPRAAIDDILAALDQFGFVVAAATPWPVRLPDPDDAPFLAVAKASAGILVTGNLRHFPASARRSVVVLTPRQLMDRYEPHKP